MHITAQEIIISLNIFWYDEKIITAYVFINRVNAGNPMVITPLTFSKLGNINDWLQGRLNRVYLECLEEFRKKYLRCDMFIINLYICATPEISQEIYAHVHLNSVSFICFMKKTFT